MNLDDSVGFLLNKAAGEMRYALETALRPHDLTPAQWSVLARLDVENGQMISDVGRSLYFDRPTMSGIVRRLESKGLLEKRRDSQDQRVFRIYITASGSELMKELPLLAKAVNQRALDGFSQEEIVTLQSLVRRVLGNMTR